MSAAAKCDRCSAFFEAAPRNVSLVITETTAIEDDVEECTTHEVDLCPKCSADFRELMKGMPT